MAKPLAKASRPAMIGIVSILLLFIAVTSSNNLPHFLSGIFPCGFSEIT